MVFGKRAAAHNGGGDRDSGGLGKFAEFVRRVAADDTAAAIKDRPLGFFDQADDLVQCDFTGVTAGIIAAKVNFMGKDRLRLGLLDILGDINNDRTGPAGLSDVKRLLDYPWDVV